MQSAFLPAQPALPARPGLPAQPAWDLSSLASRLIELSGQQSTAHLTAAFGLVLEAQLCGDRAAWITFEQSVFFPPDVAAGGVDLESLPVVRVPTALVAGRAADHLVRSGGFGLVVIDLSSAAADASGQVPQPVLPLPLLTRLLGLARTHQTAVLILTRKSSDAASLNSLISLRAEAQYKPGGARLRGGADQAGQAGQESGYDVRIRVIKDKRRAPGWDHREACRGSVGMR